MANGSHKSDAIQKTIEGNMSEECPSSAFQSHSNTIFIIDKEAALNLNSKTINQLA